MAAERGYLRETGNLVYHLALVGLLVSIAVGQFLHYRGQAIIVEGRAFANTQADYWVVYATYLHARITRGWAGHRVAYLVFVGYAVVLADFTVVNLFVAGKHSYSGI